MKRVEFNEDRLTPTRSMKKRKQTLLIRLMMKLPFISSARQANGAMIIIALAAFLASGVILMSTFGDDSEQIYIEDLTEEERESLPQEYLETLPSRSE